eukprot:7385087-Prymnesium_polylepis.1
MEQTDAPLNCPEVSKRVFVFSRDLPRANCLRCSASVAAARRRSGDCPWYPSASRTNMLFHRATPPSQFEAFDISHVTRRRPAFEKIGENGEPVSRASGDQLTAPSAKAAAWTEGSARGIRPA